MTRDDLVAKIRDQVNEAAGHLDNADLAFALFACLAQLAKSADDLESEALMFLSGIWATYVSAREVEIERVSRMS